MHNKKHLQNGLRIGPAGDERPWSHICIAVLKEAIFLNDYTWGVLKILGYDTFKKREIMKTAILDQTANLTFTFPSTHSGFPQCEHFDALQSSVYDLGQ